MKNIKIAAVVLFATITLASCQKDEINPISNPQMIENTNNVELTKGHLASENADRVDNHVQANQEIVIKPTQTTTSVKPINEL